MNLIEASTRFPTVIFAICLGVALIYWVFVLIGALDIDLFGDADVGDAVTGGAKGGAEGFKGLKVDSDGGVWAGLGLATVPITISLSLIFFFGWIASLVAMHYAPTWFGDAAWVAGITLPVSLVVGIAAASLGARPLGRVFELKEGKSNRDYVGHTCTINTGHVDAEFGQATVEDGGTVLVIPVRCDRPGVLARGDRALIIDFDSARQAYIVEPVPS